MSFEASIRQLRGNAGLSQQAVADAVGIARATYIKLENGGREPKLGELTKISQYYEVGVQELISGIAMTDTVAQQAQHSPWRVADDAALHVSDAPAEYHHDDAQRAQPTAAQSRDAIPRLHTTKLRQVLLYTLGKIGARPNVGEAVLHRLLYFIDFDYYERTGKSITGLAYLHETYGLAPAADLQALVDEMRAHDELDVIETKHFSHKQRKFLPLKNAELSELSANEIKHIDAELERLGSKSATELSNLAYKDAPWVIAKYGQTIDYRDTFYRTDVTSVIESDDDL